MQNPTALHRILITFQCLKWSMECHNQNATVDKLITINGRRSFFCFLRFVSGFLVFFGKRSLVIPVLIIFTVFSLFGSPLRATFNFSFWGQPHSVKERPRFQQCGQAGIVNHNCMVKQGLSIFKIHHIIERRSLLERV